MNNDTITFSFENSEPLSERTDLLSYFHSYLVGKWYEPPIGFNGLAKAFRSSPHHSSAIYAKRNILAGTFKPNELLSRKDFAAIVLDFLIFGNCYLETITNRLGELIGLKPSLAKYTRRGEDLNTYYYVPNFDKEHKYRKGAVIHLLEPDINQEIYGLPEYLSAMSSAFLNQDATLFRMRYYRNGSHAGYIMYLTDSNQDSRDIEALREAIKSSKGPGNFKNLFMYSPGGQQDGLKVIPLSEVSAKDEFLNIKNVTRDDVLAAHRVPPQLMSIMPNVTGGFGNLQHAAVVFNLNEIKPLQNRFLEINELLGKQVVDFEDYALELPGQISSSSS